MNASEVTPTRDQTRAHPGYQVLVINLDRSPDRLKAMADRLAAYNLNWERVPAVDGRTLDIACHPHVADAGYRRLHGREILASEVGCYFSHLKACQQFLAGPHDYAVIFEDDADLLDDPRPVLDALTARPRLWDVAKLSGIHRGAPVALSALPGGRNLCVTLSRYTGANAYVINRHAARVYLKHLLPMELPYDIAFDRAWRYGIRFRSVFPPVCAAYTPNTPSTILPATRQARLSWYRRGSTYAYRVGTDLRRVAHGLGQIARYKLLARGRHV